MTKWYSSFDWRGGSGHGTWDIISSTHLRPGIMSWHDGIPRIHICKMKRNEAINQFIVSHIKSLNCEWVSIRGIRLKNTFWLLLYHLPLVWKGRRKEGCETKMKILYYASSNVAKVDKFLYTLLPSLALNSKVVTCVEYDRSWWSIWSLSLLLPLLHTYTGASGCGYFFDSCADDAECV